MKKWSDFGDNEETDCFLFTRPSLFMIMLDCTIANLANICPHNFTDTDFYILTVADSGVLERNRVFVVGPSIVFTSTRVVDGFFTKSHQTHANLFWAVMLVNYTIARCLSLCQMVFIRVGIFSERRISSDIDKTRPVALKFFSCPIFNVH